MKAEELLKIGNLFAQLGWPVERNETQFPHLFDSFVRMCSRLAKPHRDLILELTPRYLWIKPDEYDKRLKAAFKELATKLSVEIETVIVAPLAKPDGVPPTSADQLFKMAQGNQALIQSWLGTRKLRFLKTAAQFAQEYDWDQAACLVLIDDYVGSGDTTIKALTDLYRSPKSIRHNAVYLLAIAVQGAAFARINAAGCRVVAQTLLTRGISDHEPSTGSIDESIDRMKELGKRLKFRNEQALGWGGTEALVTLTRTPNNTFPVFWTNRKVDAITWDSPFTRYTDSG